MKKFVSLFTGMLMIVSVFAQTNFQELTLEKPWRKRRASIRKFSWIVTRHGADRVK